MSRLMRLAVLMMTLVLLAGCATVGQRTSAEDIETSNRYADIGFRHLEFDNTQRARQSFREALDLNRNSGRGHLGMAMVYQRDAEAELAEDYFKRAMALDSDTQIRYLYAQFLFRQGRIDESKQELIRVTNNPDFINRGLAFEDLALVNLYENDVEAAKRHFDRAITLNRMLPMPYWHMANIHLAQGNQAQAYRYYEGFENLVRADVMDHTEESLILGLRVTEAVDREETYSGLLEILREQFPNSPFLQRLDNE